MAFNSPEFLIFLPIVIILYYLIPFKFRWIVLLIASYIFYMVWNPKYIILIVISTLIDYTVSIKMEKINEKKKRKPYLLISLFANLSLLFVFKYFNFFDGLLTYFSQNVFGSSYAFPVVKLLLPMGISFYTFQTLSYTIDVYRGERKAEKHLGYFALYVTYFPQLVAGPIERSERLLTQLKTKQSFDYYRTVSSIYRIAWGFFKKVVIADRVAVVVNTVYGDLHSYSGVYLMLATVLFAFQIYCDFSGYSDIAIGSANLMGHKLMENFKMPYFSHSITEFWKRWHISLTTWFKDYLYIPLGGNRIKNKLYLYRNILIVFVVSGLWHGANMTFVLWGLFHGLLQIIERVINDFLCKNEKLRIFKIPVEVKTLVTFILVVFGWAFFRASNLSDVVYIFKNMFTYNLWVLFDGTLYTLGLEKPDFILGILACLFLMLVEGYKYYSKKERIVTGDFKQGLVAIFIILFVVIFGFYGTYNPNDFIYFQF